MRTVDLRTQLIYHASSTRSRPAKKSSSPTPASLLPGWFRSSRIASPASPSDEGYDLERRGFRRAFCRNRSWPRCAASIRERPARSHGYDRCFGRQPALGRQIAQGLSRRMGRRDQFRLGTGAGFSADRLDPAVDLVAKGRLDAIVFECIGERTLAFGHRDRMADPEAGYNPLLERRLRQILPLCVGARHAPDHQHGGRQPARRRGQGRAGGARARAARLEIAALEGDDVGALIGADTPLPDSGLTVGEVGRPMVGANAYLGADAHPAGARGRCRRRDHGPRRRSQPVPRAAAPRLRLGGGRLADRSAPARWSGT